MFAERVISDAQECMHAASGLFWKGIVGLVNDLVQVKSVNIDVCNGLRMHAHQHASCVVMNHH